MGFFFSAKNKITLWEITLGEGLLYLASQSQNIIWFCSRMHWQNFNLPIHFLPFGPCSTYFWFKTSSNLYIHRRKKALLLRYLLLLFWKTALCFLSRSSFSPFRGNHNGGVGVMIRLSSALFFFQPKDNNG